MNELLMGRTKQTAAHRSGDTSAVAVKPNDVNGTEIQPHVFAKISLMRNEGAERISVRAYFRVFSATKCRNC